MGFIQGQTNDLTQQTGSQSILGTPDFFLSTGHAGRSVSFTVGQSNLNLINNTFNQNVKFVFN